VDLLAYRSALARKQSPRWTPRQKRLNALSRILRGQQYEHLKYPFTQEREGDPFSGRRILLDDRRPAVQVKQPKQLVREQCGLIFGEDHRPMVLVKKPKAQQLEHAKPNADGDSKPAPTPADDPTNEWIAAFIHDTNFWLVLMDALWKGSIGSSAIVLRVLGKTKHVDDTDAPPDPKTRKPATKKVSDGKGRYYFEVWNGEECSPIFDSELPDELAELERRYFIGEDALRAQGYDVDALKEEWRKKLSTRGPRKSLLKADEWAIRLRLLPNEELCYLPVPRYFYERPDWKDSQWQLDADRSFMHDIGEVNAGWVVPLPLDADELYPDGACLFEDVIDPEFRQNRSLSQAGRAFDYSGDPQLARLIDKATGSIAKSNFGKPVAMGGTSSDIIEGDAKFVEMTGDGLKVNIETYVAAISDYAKAAGAMSRIMPDSKTGAAPDLSSVAMKMLNFAQLVCSGILRETAAEIPGSRMLRLAMRLWKKVDVDLPSLESPVKPDDTARFEWQWPDYYEPHGQEKLFEQQAINAALESNTISHETAVANTGPMFDVVDPTTEIAKIKSDKQDADDAEVVQADALAAVTAKHEPKTGAADGSK
jgi:hypothetical protein